MQSEIHTVTAADIERGHIDVHFLWAGQSFHDTTYTVCCSVEILEGHLVAFVVSIVDLKREGFTARLLPVNRNLMAAGHKIRVHAYPHTN
jgi:hypothetical protein